MVSKLVSLISPWRWWLIGGAGFVLLSIIGGLFIAYNRQIDAAYEAGVAVEKAKAEAARLALEVETHKRIAERQQKQFDLAAAQALEEAQEAREAEDLIATRLREIQASEKAAEAENARLESQIAFLNAELTDATKDQTRTDAERNELNDRINALKSKLRSCGLSPADLAADNQLHKQGSR